MTVFLTTHYMEEASAANRIIIIDKGTIHAEGTPFELKEKYAYDSCRLYTCDNNIARLANLFKDTKTEFDIKDYGISFRIKSTVDPLALIEKARNIISGFEVIQGNMDDVFLNAVKDFEGGK